MKTTNPGDPSRWVRVQIAAAVVWIGAWLVFGPSMDTPGRLITTGANATLTAQLPDRGVLSVGPHSRVRVDDEQHIAYVDAGEVTLDVLLGPFAVETPIARATVPEQAKLRVSVSSSLVAFEVLAGVVLVHQRGVRPGKPALQLKKGDFHRVQIDAMASAIAEHRRPGLQCYLVASGDGGHARCPRYAVSSYRDRRNPRIERLTTPQRAASA